MYLWIFKNASYANVHLGNLKIHVINLFGVAVICWVNTYPRRIIKSISQQWLLQMDTQLYLPSPQVMVTHSGSGVDSYLTSWVISLLGGNSSGWLMKHSLPQPHLIRALRLIMKSLLKKKKRVCSIFSRLNVCVHVLHPTIHFILCPQRYSVLIFVMSDPTAPQSLVESSSPSACNAQGVWIV